MPQPDVSGSVIVVSSKIKKSNGSWVLGRLVRDLEGIVEEKMEPWERNSGLVVSVFDVSVFFFCLYLSHIVPILKSRNPGNLMSYRLSKEGRSPSQISASTRSSLVVLYNLSSPLYLLSFSATGPSSS